MMKRVAVIGLGNIATRHRRNLKFLFPQARLYAMSASGRIPGEDISDCDELVTSLEALIRTQVELVIVASPAPYHASHAIPLIEASIPTLIEKPVTASMADSEAILHAVKEHNTPVAVGYCLRYLSSAQKMKHLLQSNKIGHLYNAFAEVGQYLPDWRPSKDYRDSVSVNPKLGGGALLELSHELDYIQWLLGSLSVKHSILRSSEELDLDVEDSADILTTTDNGTVVSIHLDFLQCKAHRMCRFVGSTGVLEWDLIQNEILFIGRDSSEVLFSEPEWDKNLMYLTMVKDFVEQIQGSEHHSVSVETAMRTVDLIEEIKQTSCER